MLYATTHLLVLTGGGGEARKIASWLSGDSPHHHPTAQKGIGTCGDGCGYAIGSAGALFACPAAKECLALRQASAQQIAESACAETNDGGLAALIARVSFAFYGTLFGRSDARVTCGSCR